jgi:hypothetical protein
LDELFREIDEELRNDRLRQIWQRQGTAILAAAALVIAAYGGFVGWQNWRERQWEAAAAQYLSAMNIAQAGDPASAASAAAALETLSSQTGSGYALLGRIEAAVLKIQTQQPAPGLAALKAIAADDSIAAGYRHLAAILWGYYGVDTLPAKDIASAMGPLAAAGPWRFSATEIEALADLRAGDKKTALTLFQSLADDLSAPGSLRARAAEIVSDLQN